MTFLKSVPPFPQSWLGTATDPQAVRRDVLLDLEEVFESADDSWRNSSYAKLYSDILVVPNDDITITVPAVTNIYTNILASDSSNDAINIRFKKQEGVSNAVIWLTAGECQKQVNVHLEYETGMYKTASLPQGFFETKAAVSFIVYGDDLSTDRETILDRPDMWPADYYRSLQTRLMVSGMLSWTWPTLALQQTSAIREATEESSKAVRLHFQATTQENWLESKVMAGPNTHLAPTLNYDVYLDQVSATLDTATDFEDRFEQLNDEATSAELQMEAWGTMKEKADTHLTTQGLIQTAAEEEFDRATDVLLRGLQTFRSQQIAMAFRQKALEKGIEKYVAEQTLLKILEFGLALLGKT